MNYGEESYFLFFFFKQIPLFNVGDNNCARALTKTAVSERSKNMLNLKPIVFSPQFTAIVLPCVSTFVKNTPNTFLLVRREHLSEVIIASDNFRAARSSYFADTHGR